MILGPISQELVHDQRFVDIHLNPAALLNGCLLYTSDAADERSSVDLGGRRIIKKKNKKDSAHSAGAQNNITNKTHT
mgnify:CR=1 FL=1